MVAGLPAETVTEAGAQLSAGGITVDVKIIVELELQTGILVDVRVYVPGPTLVAFPEAGRPAPIPVILTEFADTFLTSQDRVQRFTPVDVFVKE